MTAPFLLASASPRRLALLAQIHLKPSRILPADIDETPRKNELPLPYALRMAEEKARAVAMQAPTERILAADTVVCCGRRILPKAEDEKAACQCLELLSGRRHRVITAVALMDGQKLHLKSAETMVRFRRLSAADIEQYIASKDWQGKAGGYAIQGLAAAFIPAINGSYSNVVGLPLVETLVLLQGS